MADEACKTFWQGSAVRLAPCSREVRLRPSGRKTDEMCDRHALVCGLDGIIDKVVVRCAREGEGCVERTLGSRSHNLDKSVRFVPAQNLSRPKVKWNLLASAAISHDVSDYSKYNVLLAAFPLPFSICASLELTNRCRWLLISQNTSFLVFKVKIFSRSFYFYLHWKN